MPHIIIIKGAHDKLAEANECLSTVEANIANGNYAGGKLASVTSAKEALENEIETATADIGNALDDLSGVM